MHVPLRVGPLRCSWPGLRPGPYNPVLWDFIKGPRAFKECGGKPAAGEEVADF